MSGRHTLSLDGLVNSGEAALFHDFLKLMLSQRNNDVLWLQVSVDDSADAMQVVKPNKDLSGYSSNQRDRDAFVVIPLHDLK